MKDQLEMIGMLLAFLLFVLLAHYSIKIQTDKVNESIKIEISDANK